MIASHRRHHPRKNSQNKKMNSHSNNHMKLLVVCTLFFLLISAINAIQSTIPTSTQDNIHKTLLQSLNKQTSLKNLHYNLVSLLKLPYKKEESKKAIDTAKDSLCKSNLLALNEESVSKLSLNDLYNMIASISALKCDVSDDIIKAIESRLETLAGTVTSIEQSYDTVRSIFLFRRQSKSLAQNKKILNNIFSTVQSKYNEQKGAFCTSDNNDNCLRQTGLALETQSILNQLLDNSKLSTLVQNARQIASLVQSVNDKTSLTSASAFVRGLTKLGSIVPLEKKISLNEFDALAHYFVGASSKQLNTVSDIYDFIEGASAIASATIYTPIFVSQLSRKADTSTVTVTVSNIFGAAASDKALKVVLNSLYKGSNPKDSLLIKPVSFTKENDTTFSWDASKTKIFDSAGAYNFDLEVQPLKYKVTLPYKLFASSVSIEDLTVSGRGIASQSVKFGEKLNTIQTAVNAQSRIIVSFKLNGMNPHQVFVRFVGNNDQDAVYVAKPSGNTYRADISLFKVGKAIQFQSGTYDMQILVGDVSLKDPIQWTFGSIDLTFQNTPELTEEQLLYAPRKEITHKFAQPAERAPQTISTVFTGLVALPLVIYLINLLRVGFNFNLYPGGAASILSLIFVGLIAGMLYVLSRFFIDVTFFPTIYRLAALGFATVIVGTKVLAAIAEKRTSQSS